MNRRNFINVSAMTAGASILTGAVVASTRKGTPILESSSLDLLSSKIADVVPISLDERKARVSKAQNLMDKNGFSAMVLDSGTSMNYFTGMTWGQSERPMVAVIPAKGEVSYICPKFEEARLEEIIQMGNKIGDKIYPWEEDESPYEQIKKAILDSGATSGKIGMEERVRFFIADGVRKVASSFEIVSADPVVIPCRIIKSPAEIALMQRATELTIEAITIGLTFLKEGGSPSDFSSAVAQAHQKMGGRHAFALANFGEASAFPHGSSKPQILKKGDVVLVDCGCTVQGYNSDISRTVVFGAAPTARQLEIWNLEKEAQAAGYKAARIGATLGEVDAAARKVITDAGFGPDYKLPGLPHRTGHGIGMDGHEWGNAVKGNTQILEPGMCFSIEPNISIVGEFGVRHEDCVYMTETGPVWFSKPSPSISQPFEL
ncbi:Xaa-Pro peptidase family protein [Algoriphagus sp.]|uniref:M24 family metallopeptidase n=1 Tax=Algoriphagus sp. TaxID=1872435 RepID=UPI00271E0621|nr:Xaa-Pro peptidase family protein [Algoriphagus sp.]MDO8968046.1 Xaa-Pro peptidase family protein [Algoriphagus sp.]MDP3199118.1 Xaa-Pro peptidase family protein [Algoriphagus sp.]